MKIEEYNVHAVKKSFQDLKVLMEDKENLLKKTENIELKFILDAMLDIESKLDKTSSFLMTQNDLNIIHQNIQNTLSHLRGFAGTYNPNIINNIIIYLSNIHKVTSSYPQKDKTVLKRSFNSIAEAYKKDSEAYKEKLDKEFIKSEEIYSDKIKKAKEHEDYLNSLVGDIRGFSSKYTTKEKAKYYDTVSTVNEKKADDFIIYAKYSMYFALGIILVPLIFSMIYGLGYNLIAIFCSNMDVDLSKASIIQGEINTSGALLKISYSLVAFFPVIFFSRLEQKYRDRAFKFKDLKNAILSINPYLSDIETQEDGAYDQKDLFKLEMAKVFFNQIHSTKKESEQDILGKFEQFSKIIRGLK